MKFIHPDAIGFNAFANQRAFLSAMEYQHYPEGLFCREKKTKNLNPLHHKKVQDYFIREGGKRRVKALNRFQPGLKTAHSQPARELPNMDKTHTKVKTGKGKTHSFKRARLA